MYKLLLLVIIFTTSLIQVVAQTTSDITLFFDITVDTKSSKPQLANMFNGATQTVYIKGTSHRTDEVNTLGTSSTIYNGTTNAAIITKEYGTQKILVNLTAAQWAANNKKYDNITFTPTNQTKIIAGYTTKGYTGKLQDGTAFSVYTTSSLNPEVNTYKNNQFAKLPGVVLQYEFSIADMQVTNTVSSVVLGSIPASKFVVNTAGYREMPYQPNK